MSISISATHSMSAILLANKLKSRRFRPGAVDTSRVNQAQIERSNRGRKRTKLHPYFRTVQHNRTAYQPSRCLFSGASRGDLLQDCTLHHDAHRACQPNRERPTVDQPPTGNSQNIQLRNAGLVSSNALTKDVRLVASATSAVGTNIGANIGSFDGISGRGLDDSALSGHHRVASHAGRPRAGFGRSSCRSSGRRSFLRRPREALPS